MWAAGFLISEVAVDGKPGQQKSVRKVNPFTDSLTKALCKLVADTYRNVTVELYKTYKNRQSTYPKIQLTNP